jgi:protein-tyrosine-phosphatase
MAKDPIIVFVCEHAAAKSIIAATCFNKLAEQTNLDMRAIARGTNPDQGSLQELSQVYMRMV